MQHTPQPQASVREEFDLANVVADPGLRRQIDEYGTASCERVFSSLNVIKTDLRNKIGDDWLNDLMICYIC